MMVPIADIFKSMNIDGMELLNLDKEKLMVSGRPAGLGRVPRWSPRGGERAPSWVPGRGERLHETPHIPGTDRPVPRRTGPERAATDGNGCGALSHLAGLLQGVRRPSPAPEECRVA